MAARAEMAAPDWDANLRQMGQLFVMGFDGTTVDPQIRSLIEDYHLGAILLTAKNLKSADETAKLVLELQTIARQAGHQSPLLIGLDQENGGVNSLFDDVYIRQFPSAMGVAATGSTKLAREVAKATAQELRAVGINWILGPVLDVLTDGKNQPLGVRSVGDDPQEVATYGVESMKGYQDGGLATCGKHFPSYGNLDAMVSQSDVPVITDTVDQLRLSALIPFRSAISQGLDSMIVGGCSMISHGMNVMHACLSEEVIEDLLRSDLGFQGVVVSDCLEMEALSSNIGVGGGTVMALKAGCDLVLVCRSFAVQQEAISGLRLGVENGMISKERVRQSLARVSAMKARRTSWEQALNPPGISLLSRLQPSHTNLSMQAYNSSITVVRDRTNLLPLSSILEPDEELLLLTPLVKPLPASAAAAGATVTAGQAGGERSRESTNSIDASSSSVSSNIKSGEAVFRELGRSLARRRNGRVLHTSYSGSGVRPIHENLINRASAVVIVTADSNRNLYQHGFTKHVSLICSNSSRSNNSSSGSGSSINGSARRNSAGYQRPKPVVVVAVSSPYDFAKDPTIGTYVCTYDFTDAALQALVRVLYGEVSPTGRMPGSLSKSSTVRRTSQPRQQWLVETWNTERDSAALDTLLASIRESEGVGGGTNGSIGSSSISINNNNDQGINSSSVLCGVSADTFLLKSADVQECHLVVRNSSTHAINGFCATYFFQSTGTGVIGAILVDPARRRLGIGSSLHSRAIQTLTQHPEVKQLQLGSRLPGVYLGIPRTDPVERRRLRRWFAKLGWSMALSRPLCSMVLRDVQSWTQPEGLRVKGGRGSSAGTSSSSIGHGEVEYDLVFGEEYADAVVEHVRTSSRQGVAEVYRTALAGGPHCGIIRAKKAGETSTAGISAGTNGSGNAHAGAEEDGDGEMMLDGGLHLGMTGTATTTTTTRDETLVGSVVVYNARSQLARLVPAVREARIRAGGISSPVISPSVGEYAMLVQGLIVLGIKEIRKQGGNAVILDCVDGDGNSDGLTTMGFSVLHSFEELTCDAAAWARS
ncbi:beta-N-acetylglucosaminidase/beta-glucosidase [Nannizzia gypsea CBS 118893]|uniref:Beta-N-acetylglucosaminidase/beta-glucosidase n=1 Tax=Arthroderma gypseum (strain ATCC MYA-4604 / CBS 118893) TaxID=535722 RepID=E4V593_ARTGP|nr:beta-N-acetylglucosaminidase/beta-glucosidase [Nannizzia gypsea CBS 118893]EFR05167.1 beta-N-acetylglucosaminidase/beta-glucosidase [Nannizzia gypsea CBS 118893]